MELKSATQLGYSWCCMSFNRTAYGIEIFSALCCIIIIISFNRTAYGIEIQQTYVIAVVVVILLIAPLMELKSTSACELALSSFLLIAPLMELK